MLSPLEVSIHRITEILCTTIGGFCFMRDFANERAKSPLDDPGALPYKCGQSDSHSGAFSDFACEFAERETIMDNRNLTPEEEVRMESIEDLEPTVLAQVSEVTGSSAASDSDERGSIIWGNE